MRGFRTLCLATFTIGIAACGGGGGDDDTTTPTETIAMTSVAGNGGSATVGQSVTDAPTVKVTSNGTAKAGVSVTFAVTGGGGSLIGATQTTGADGIARAGSWTLGNIAGANSVTATATGASGSPIIFLATGVADAAVAATKVDGDAITSSAGLAVSAKPSVKITDAFGNPKSGIAVTFAVASGGGSATGTSQTTGADGRAVVGTWTLGTVAGANTMTAVAAGITGTSTFTATGAAGPVATVTKVTGDLQTAIAGSLLGIAPSVRVADQFGNLIAGQPVTFAVASGGGSVTGATPSSNATGVATVGGWTLGSVVGANSLSATAAAISVTFTATATAAFNAAQYAGTYVGSWTNTTFGSTGNGNAVISVNAAASTTTVTVNVTGNVLGAGGVTNAVNAGSFTNSGATFNGNVAPMGNISATINANGAITATGANVPNGTISGWTATGTLTSTTLQMSFTVNFFAGAPAVGTITLTKQ